MYRRITTYIYSYWKGERDCNCGYYRIDERDGHWKLSVSVKVPGRYTMGVTCVYAVYCADKKTGNNNRKAALLGKTSALNGDICYKHISSSDNVVDGVCANDIVGILIFDGENMDRAFAGDVCNQIMDLTKIEFDEKEDDSKYSWEDFTYQEELDEERDIVRESCNAGSEDMGGENDIAGMEDVDDQKNVDGQDIMYCQKDMDEQTIMDREKNIGNQENIDKKIDNDSNEYKSKDEKPANEETKENTKSESGGNISPSWQQLIFSKFPKVVIKFDNNYCEAVKMRPHDLVWFPRRYWRFSNNPCLLKGYYTYRYILLVKGTDTRDGIYYLAVPGKYSCMDWANYKRYGFEEFVSGSGDEGFWCYKLVI